MAFFIFSRWKLLGGNGLYISQIKLAGYRACNEELVVPLKSGLTVLVGENGTGKSTVIDGMRLLLMEDEYGRSGIIERDFFRPYGAPTKVNATECVKIECIFNELDKEEQVAYLPWLNPENLSQASLHLQIQNREDTRGRYKRTIWGGSARGIFEWELLEFIHCVYLPPLRNAEEKLQAYRGSH